MVHSFGERLKAERLALAFPIERDAGVFQEPPGCERYRLPSLENRSNDVRSEERQARHPLGSSIRPLVRIGNGKELQSGKLITLHNSKGREFDGVALICMNNGSIPHFSTSTQEAYDESRRLFYVGLTRAKRILLVASDQSHWKNTPTPFIAEAGLG